MATPARRFSRSSRSFSRSRKAPGTWGRVVDPATNYTAGAKASPFQFVLSNAGINETIRRTIISILFKSDQASASENPNGAFGMGVFTSQAVSVGITALPGPLSEADDDVWFVWMPLMDSIQVGATASTFNNGKLFERDFRGMRKVVEGEEIVAMIEIGTSGATAIIGASLYATRTM